MAGRNPLPRLRQIRDEERRIEARLKALKPERDRLIRESVKQEKTERQIAEAAGVHHSRVHQIVHRR